MTARLRLVPPPSLPPIPCAPWCQDGHGHTDSSFRADQYCTSAVPDGVMDVADRGGQVVMGLIADPAEPLYFDLCAMNDDGTTAMQLTLDEAQRLGTAILATCALAAQDNPRRDGAA